jgi:transposase InsO family protein
VDESTRECLAIDVDRRLRLDDVLHRLSELFVQHGVPEHIRSDNGPEFAAKAVREWLHRVGGGQTLFIEPGSPWENGYVERVNGKVRDELLNGEIFETRWEATVLIERRGAPTTRFVRTARWAIDRPRRKPSCRNTPDSHCGWYNHRGQISGVMPVFLLPVPLLLPMCDGFDRIEFQGNEAKRLHTSHIAMAGFVLMAGGSGGGE